MASVETANSAIKSIPIQQQLLYNFLSGGVAGMFTDMVFYPLETLKTRLQVE